MKLSGITKTITNTELAALSLSVAKFNKSFNTEWNEQLYKNLKSLEDKLFELVKGNTNTHYEININGVGNFSKETEQEIDKILSGSASSISTEIQ